MLTVKKVKTILALLRKQRPLRPLPLNHDERTCDPGPYDLFAAFHAPATETPAERRRNDADLERYERWSREDES